jgi:hypothetical protein
MQCVRSAIMGGELGRGEGEEPMLLCNSAMML